MRGFWRMLSVFLLGGVLGTAFGVAAGFFVYPFVFPPPPAAEQLSEADKAKPVASGTFIHANPSDPIHWGRGKVSVYDRAVFLEPDFEVGPGPAFHVYLVPRAGIRQSSDALRSTMATLQTLAENTDGRAIVNRNDLAKGMQQIVRDSSGYYLLGYNSTQAPQDGKFHEIKVRIKRSGVQVRARKGYWAMTATEAARAVAPPKPGPPPAVSRAIASLPPTSGERFIRTWVGSAPGENGHTKVTFVWERVNAAPGIRREEATQVALVATSAEGAEVYNGTVPLDRSSIAFDAPPGRLRLRMDVQGAGDSRLDSEEREVTVPDLTSTDVMLGTPRVFVARTAREFQDIAANPDATPSASRQFRRTQRLLVRVETFGKSDSPVAVKARLLNKQGQAMADVPVKAPAEAGAPNTVDLPLSSLAAGEYLLELSAAADGQPAATELIAFRLTS